jgi:hypothetical protein
VPDTGIDAGDPVALLTMETLPVAAPAAEGANCTASVMLWEGARVTADPPVNENLAPVKLMFEIATSELPEFMTMMLRDAVLLTVTLAKWTLVGFTERVSVAAIPVPLSATVEGGFAASLTNAKVPDKDPAALGLNCTLKLLD